MKKAVNRYALVVIVLVLFILLHLISPLDKLTAIFDNFSKLAIGISALIASYAGGLYFIEDFRRKRLIDFYRKRYPHDKHGKQWKIIVREDRLGEPYVLDVDTKVKHHIWNMKTIYDLSWQFYDRESVSMEEFDSYGIGEPVRTRGELGE